MVLCLCLIDESYCYIVVTSDAIQPLGNDRVAREAQSSLLLLNLNIVAALL